MATATATPTPLPGDPRFGVILHSKTKDDNRHFLEELGVNWYLNFAPTTDQVPVGANKVPFIAQVTPGNLLSTTTIAELVTSAPSGSYWYVGGELNDPAKFVRGADFADVFHYYYTEIKKNDQNANVLGRYLQKVCKQSGGVRSL